MLRLRRWPRPKTVTRGDTIVEVLIATAVIGMILAPSAAIVSRTVNVTRGSQERSEATQALRGQIDLLRSAMTTSAADAYLDTATHKVFCVNPSNPGAGPVDLSGINSSSLSALKADALASPNPYPATCVSGRYYLAIEKPKNTNGPYTFHARWDGITDSREEITFYYRLHKEVAIANYASSTCPLASPVTYTFDPGGPRNSYLSDNNRVSGPAGVEPPRLGPFALTLPSGGIPEWDNYTVTLTSYDTHDLYIPDENPHEQWHMILRDAANHTTYVSPNTTDVPTVLVDGVRQGPPDVFTGQTIQGGSVSIIAEHIGIGSNGFHVDSATISCP